MKKILLWTVDSSIVFGSSLIVLIIGASVFTIFVFAFAIVFALLQDFLSKFIMPHLIKVFHQHYIPCENNSIDYIVLITSLPVSIFIVGVLLAVSVGGGQKDS
jgi:hypothetical protein